MMPAKRVSVRDGGRKQATAVKVLWALLYSLAVLVFWSPNLLGLPGNWMIQAATILYAGLIPEDSSGITQWTAVTIVTSLALVGELIELGASVAGVRRVGGSRRGAGLALIGSVVGAMPGLFVGVPIPVIGSVIAALVFAGLGAFLVLKQAKVSGLCPESVRPLIGANHVRLCPRTMVEVFVSVSV